MRSRRAISVLELTLSLLVLTVVVTALAQLLATAAAHRRVTELRRIAVQEVANQAERIALLTWDETTAEKLGSLKPSESLQAANPAAKLQLALSDEAGPPVSKRIEIEVHWTDAAG